MSPKKGMKPGVNKDKQQAVLNKMMRPAMRGNNPRTMTTVSGFNQYAPDPDDTIMEIGKPVNDLILVHIVPGNRQVGVNKHGTVSIPNSTVCYFAHKDVPYTWISTSHHHYVVKVAGKRMYPSKDVDRKLFGG